jgi:hypothetical protein
MGVEADPGSLSLDELRRRAWQQLEPVYLERLAVLIGEFAAARSRHRGLDDLSEIAVATIAGRVQVLLVEADRQLAGRVDPATGRIEQGEWTDPEVGDVLSDLAGAVLRMKGQVVVVPRERMPTGTGAAATCRY